MEFERDFTRILEQRLSEKLNFMQVILGARQVGKSSGVLQIAKKWPKDSFIYETADDLLQPDASWIELQWNRARKLNSPALLILDEIQKIRGWDEKIKKLFDEDRSKKKIKVVLLGSASLSINRGLSESLAGRFEIIPATHWGYKECKDAFNWNLDQYLQFGGYPAGAELINDEVRWQQFMKNSVLEPVIARDVLGVTSISKPALFRQTFEVCMSYPAQEISLNKILGSLQDSGNVTTIKHYLNLFEGAFLLKVLYKYSGSVAAKKVSIPKMLPLCPALVHAFIRPAKVKSDPDWRGRMFELAVGVELANSQGELSYWREGNYEVDYILRVNDKLIAVEVKSGRKKNLNGLQKFIEKFPKALPVIITPENFQDIKKLIT